MIYLDNNATTQPDPEILQLVNELEQHPLNPSSPHSFGRKAREYVTIARRKVKESLKTQEGYTVFCSSGTEAVNLAIRGILSKFPGHTITSSCEHSSVIKTLQSLQSNQNQITIVPAGMSGTLTTEHVLAHEKKDTKLIVTSSVNPETGLISDIESLADLAQKRNYFLIVDAIAHWGRYPFNLHPGVTAVCLSGHKFHGIKGGAACHFQGGIFPNPILTGGGQEHGFRSGTENVTAIAALAKAMEICDSNMDQIVSHLEKLSSYAFCYLENKVPGILWNGNGKRAPHTLNFALPKLSSEETVFQLDMEGIAIGFGSACSANVMEPSHVLLGMGYDLARVKRSVRLSFSRMNSLEDVKECCKTIERICKGKNNST
ncbi:cysteine desulfurase family protein [Candidatus Similichlamydia epinepheli]|uniref:cysteine desulfurase family protein n=1 Tax=Candidatus Similichlamydia epinepheli TaxID=1903953 RepID=UPI0013003003|nr:cysteine desulfurase family protein [Candidatus Similichlamydia epinepheli]